MFPAEEDILVTLSSLEHYTYCPRQCALIFVEGIWDDNTHTIAGTLLHEHVDSPGYEIDDEIKTLRSLPLFSKRYGLVGKADVVELHDGKPIPVEYKKGRKKKWENDDIQLCAQALCLEEMFSTEVPHGYIYHAGSKRRRDVVFNEELREETLRTIEAVRTMLTERAVPPAALKPQCEGCSIRGICLPEVTGRDSISKEKKYERGIWEA